MMPVSRALDRLTVSFDDPGLVVNAGLLSVLTAGQRHGCLL